MQSFKCREGMNWEFSFTVLLRRKIRKQVDIDILTLISKDTLTRLAEETDLWVDMIWIVVKSQANGRDIDFETFFTKHIDEELLQKIADLFFDEVIEYAPPEKKTNLRKAVRILRRTGEETINNLMKHIESIDEDSVVAEMTQEIERSLVTKSTSGSTS